MPNATLRFRLTLGLCHHAVIPTLRRTCWDHHVTCKIDYLGGFLTKEYGVTITGPAATLNALETALTAWFKRLGA